MYSRNCYIFISPFSHTSQYLYRFPIITFCIHFPHMTLHNYDCSVSMKTGGLYTNDSNCMTVQRHLACPVEVFSVVAHSGSMVRIIYRNLYCLAVQMLPGGLVAVRDGAFSSFDNSRIIDEFLPIQGLKVAFISNVIGNNDAR